MLFNIGKKLYKISCKINDNKLLVKIITQNYICFNLFYAYFNNKFFYNIDFSIIIFILYYFISHILSFLSLSLFLKINEILNCISFKYIYIYTIEVILHNTSQLYKYFSENL